MAERARKPLTEKQKAERKQAKVDNFIRLAKKRMMIAIIKIGYIGNCFSNTYEYTPEQASKMITALRKAVDDIEKQAAKSSGMADSFSF